MAGDTPIVYEDMKGPGNPKAIRCAIEPEGIGAMVAAQRRADAALDRKLNEESRGYVNTDRELWREREGDYYADSIHVTAQGNIGLNVKGHVIVMSVQDWHALAEAEYKRATK